MAPRRQLQLPAGSVEVCLDAACHLIDAHQLYLNLLSPSHVGTRSNVTLASSYDDPEDQPVLMWTSDSLNYSKRHKVVITLIERNPELGWNHGNFLKGITLNHVTYTRVFLTSSERYVHLNYLRDNLHLLLL